MGVTSIVAISAVVCVFLLSRAPSAAFYFLPSRAWELGFGSAVAILVRRQIVLPGSAWLRAAAWAVLAVVPFLATEAGHPGWPAVAVCLATSLILFFPPANILLPVQKVLGLVGDRSYSLYLVHWPIFAYANNVFADHPSAVINTVLLLVSVGFAEIQFRLVERPLRRISWSFRPAAALAFGMPVVVTGALLLSQFSRTNSDTDARRANVGFGVECTSKGLFQDLETCRNGIEPKVLVWGDSFAMHLVPGMAAVANVPVQQATQPVCGPFVDIGPLSGAVYNATWAEQCIEFNDSVVAYVAMNPHIEVVALSSSLLQYLPSGGEEPKTAVFRLENGFHTQGITTSELLASAKKTAQLLRDAGKRVVWIGPPPSIGFDVGRCLARRAEGLPVVADFDGCDIDVAAYRIERQAVLNFLDALPVATGMGLIRPDEYLCAAEHCSTALDGQPLYRDAAHLSYDGSVALAQKADLFGQAMMRAR